MRLNTTLIIAGLFAAGAATAYMVIPRATSLPERSRGPAPAMPAAASQEPGRTYSPEELDNLVAPIALYPDTLLSQVLVASSYPREVEEADRWLRQNSSIHNTELMDAARQQNWDPSVQALVIFPEVLAKLTQDMQWTTDLGNAYVAQPTDVMAAVQRMRARAQAAGKLTTTKEQKVITEKQEWDVVIEIQPADPEVLYVPAYNPVYIWGPPVWGYYPALVYAEVGFVFEPAIDVAYFFPAWYGWDAWGWYPDWFGDAVYVNPPFFADYGFLSPFGPGFHGPAAWHHNPAHAFGGGHGLNGGGHGGGANGGGNGGGRNAGGNGGRNAGGNGRNAGGNGGQNAGGRNGGANGVGGRNAGANGLGGRNAGANGLGGRNAGANGGQNAGGRNGGANGLGGRNAGANGFGGGNAGANGFGNRNAGANGFGNRNAGANAFGGRQANGGFGAGNQARGGMQNFNAGRNNMTASHGGSQFGNRSAQNFNAGRSNMNSFGGGSTNSFRGGATNSFRGGSTNSFRGGSTNSFRGGSTSRMAGGSRSFSGGGRSFGGGGRSFGGGRRR